ncbi:ABC transporter permease [Alkalihalobacillus pseudalcaliphilus]|uniref:ABC transporter permease n=1 Tax=Alkalihalobacillus pseudalcaliphilus TaxID=79884 RepID=UPI000A43763A|nr:ABC transporter permease [Alkalihalobacillus pseudalcaliphilus]
MFDYILANSDRFISAVQSHLLLSGMALLIALIVCIPLGILCAKYGRISSTVMNVVNGIRVIPSLAILVIVLPIMGTGFYPALFALTVLACPPILINTYIGFRDIDRDVKEAAAGMGLSQKHLLWKIEWPLATPLMITGCRTASVEVIAGATLAAFIGGGGLGQFIINGLGMYNMTLLLVGAIPVAMLTIFSEIIFSTLERGLTSYQRAI